MSDVTIKSIRNGKHFTDCLYPSEEAIPLDVVDVQGGKPRPIYGGEKPKERWTKELDGLGSIESKKERDECTRGLELSDDPRLGWQATIEVKGLHGRSVVIPAHNSTGKQGEGVTSSLNRRASRVAMMRRVENGKGVSDYYTGRVDSLDKAVEQAGFLFLSELEQGRKGIVENKKKKDGEHHYEFTFAAQSLLSTAIVGDDVPKYKQAIKAYADLDGKVITVPHPTRPNRFFRVKINVLPLAATQFNWMNKIEWSLGKKTSGELEARRQSQSADQALRKYFIEKQIPAGKLRNQINHTFALLEKERDNVRGKAWKEVLYRAYLCRLLGIPLVVHCKSSVDRTSLAGAMITAMNQWIDSEREVPDDIAEIVDKQVGDDKDLFKEVFAQALGASLVNTEISRGEYGFKYNTPKKIGGVTCHLGTTSPALVDLLPDRYLVKKSGRQAKIFLLRAFMVAIYAGLIFAAVVSFVGVGFVAAFAAIVVIDKCTNKKIWGISHLASLILLPWRLFRNAPLMIAEKEVKPDHKVTLTIDGEGQTVPLYASTSD